MSYFKKNLALRFLQYLPPLLASLPIQKLTLNHLQPK